MKELNCLRCGKELVFLKKEKIQLGQTGFVLGDWPNLFAGSLESEIYYCPKCHKVEFFAGENMEEAEEDRIAQKTCPSCKREHDMDYPKCPYCGHDYR